MTKDRSPDWQDGYAQGLRAARFAVANHLLEAEDALTGDFATGTHDPACGTGRITGKPCRNLPCFCWCHRTYLIPD